MYRQIVYERERGLEVFLGSRGDRQCGAVELMRCVPCAAEMKSPSKGMCSIITSILVPFWCCWSQFVCDIHLFLWICVDMYFQYSTHFSSTQPFCKLRSLYCVQNFEIFPKILHTEQSSCVKRQGSTILSSTWSNRAALPISEQVENHLEPRSGSCEAFIFCAQRCQS